MTTAEFFSLMRHQWRGRLWRFTALLFSLLQSVWGQSVVDSHQATAQTLGDLKEFKPGQKIRVSRTNAESVASRFVSFTEEGLVVHVKQGQITVARSQITKITEPSRGKRLRNTLIGLAAGGSIGAAVARGPLSSYPRDVPLAAATLFSQVEDCLV